MNGHFLWILLILLSSCGDKQSANISEDSASSGPPPYDTIAIDSFSPGATPKNAILNNYRLQLNDSVSISENKREPKPDSARGR